MGIFRRFSKRHTDSCDKLEIDQDLRRQIVLFLIEAAGKNAEGDFGGVGQTRTALSPTGVEWAL